MAKFQKSKFRNGGRVSSEQKWVDLDHPKRSWERRSKSSGIFAKSIASAVRKSVRESLRTPKTKSAGYSRPSHSYKPVKTDAVSRTTLTIDEMPEELRYLSYPHLKPKPQPKVVAKPVQEAAPERVRSKAGTYWELLEIIRLFFLDIRGKSKTEDEAD